MHTLAELYEATEIDHIFRLSNINTDGYRALKECGKDVRLYLIQGADHGGAEFWTNEVIDIVDSFIQRCIKG